MTPPDERDNVSDAAGTPKTFVFTLPGQTVDTRLVVFGTEFHVHSVLLKLRSSFFRKLMDSSDIMQRSQITLSNALGALVLNKTYHWVTKIDDDGTWHLVDASKFPKRSNDYSKFEGNQKDQIHAFEDLLCAIYSEPYEIETFKHLEIMIELAGYYGALTVLSRSLDGVFFRSSYFGDELELHCARILPLAVKLRHATLFRECIILCTCNWMAPSYLEISDPKLRKIARNAYNSIAEKAAKAQSIVLCQFKAGSVEDSKHAWVTYARKMLALASSGNDVDLPKFLRLLGYGFSCSNELDEALESLSTNNLKICQTTDKAAFDNVFLCAEIDDDDIPWDMGQLDW